MENTKDIRSERQPMRRILTALAVLGVALAQPRPSTAESGALTQLPPPNACTLEDGDGVLCRDALGMLGAFQTALSPDGKSLYVTALFGHSVAIFSRNTSTGALTQLAEPNGCVANTGDGVTCTDVVGLSAPGGVTVSGDGKYVYVGGSSGIAVFARSSSTGQLTQLPGSDGCLSPFGAGGCGTITGLTTVSRILVTGDGKHLYASSRNGDAVGVFARDRFTGAITQLPAPAGCIAENGDGITCVDAVGLDGPEGLMASRNGRQVYVASTESDTLAVFERDRTTGALTQFPAPAGCIAENGDGVTCTDAVGLNGVASISMPKTGRQLYVASRESSSIAIFARHPGTGALTQLAAPNGCIAFAGDGVTCASGLAIGGASSIAVTENGKHAYVAAPNSHAVAVFARDKKTGALTQLAAPNGCMNAVGGSCTGGLALNNAIGVTIPKNGKHVYVNSYGGSSIASFARQP